MRKLSIETHRINFLSFTFGELSKKTKSLVNEYILDLRPLSSSNNMNDIETNTLYQMKLFKDRTYLLFVLFIPYELDYNILFK